MKKISSKAPGRESDEMPAEYPPGFFRGGVRGKYYEQYVRSRKLVRIEPDLAEEFPNEQMVNQALRLARQIRRLGKSAKRNKTAG